MLRGKCFTQLNEQRSFHPVGAGTVEKTGVIMSRLKLKFTPDPIGDMLGTGYKRFESSVGINGLAKVTGKRIDILAVVATRQRTGQFRRFIAAAKNAYDVVAVWEDWNPVISEALQRYGFRRTWQHEEYGARVAGWIFGEHTAADLPGLAVGDGHQLGGIPGCLSPVGKT